MAEEKCAKMTSRLEDLDKDIAVAEKGREDSEERQELLERLDQRKRRGKRWN